MITGVHPALLPDIKNAVSHVTGNSIYGIHIEHDCNSTRAPINYGPHVSLMLPSGKLNPEVLSKTRLVWDRKLDNLLQ